jgi:hypothetical protein
VHKKATNTVSPRHFRCSCTQELTHVEHLTAFYDVRWQDINERMPAVERRTPPIFGGNDSLDYRQVALAERIVLIAKETLPPAVGLLGIDPTLHDTTADKGSHFFGAVPRVK